MLNWHSSVKAETISMTILEVVHLKSTQPSLKKRGACKIMKNVKMILVML